MAATTDAEERVEVRRGSSFHVAGVHAGHREVEHHQVRVRPRIRLINAEIGRFDIAVGDADPFQGHQRGQQVGAPALQDVDGQPAAVVEFLGQGGAPGVTQKQRGAATHLEAVVEGDDAAFVLQLAEHLRLGVQPFGRLGVLGDLEDAFGVADLFVVDEDADGGGPGAQLLLVDEAAVEDVGRQRVEGVGAGALVEDLLAGLAEFVEEGADVGDPLGGAGIGGVEYQLPEFCTDLRHLGGEVQAAVSAQPVDELTAFGGRRLAAEDVERKRAEAEDVDARRVGGSMAFRGGEELRGVAGAGRHQAERSRGQPADGGVRVGGQHAGAVPVGDLREQLRAAFADGDGARVEGAVHDSVAVGVVHDVGDIADEVELAFQRKRGLVVGQPQVERDVTLGLREHQADAQFGLVDDVLGYLQAVEAQSGEQVVFGGDGAVAGVLVGGRGALAGEVEADAGVAFGVDVVECRPVLPAVAVGQRLLVDDPRADLALPAGCQSDGLHEAGDELAVALGDRIMTRRGQQSLRDAGQPRATLEAVETVEVDLRTLGEFALELRVVQEHQFLHVRDSLDGLVSAALTDRVLQQRGEVLRLAAGEQQRRVLGAAVAPPQVIIAGEDAAVVLQLDQEQFVGGEDKKVDLVPTTAGVAELEVRPGPVRGSIGKGLLDELETLLFVGELRLGDLDPASVPHRSIPPWSCAW